MKTIYYTATSLDGFLATPDDDVSWLDQWKPHEDTFTPFIANVGAICTGASTYRFLLRYVEQGNAWPHEQPMWVFTTHDLPIPKGADVKLVRGDVRPVHAAMRAAAKGKDLWVVGGGGLAGQFLEAGLLDELVITVASCTLGAGKPLLPVRANLSLLGARALGEGFAELRYVPATNGQAAAAKRLGISS